MEPDLLINISDEYSNYAIFKIVVEKELNKCASKSKSRLFFAVAYIKKNAIEKYITKFKDILEKEGSIRILTCLDFGMTEIEALKSLIELKKYGDIKIQIYYKDKGNFHPKVYLFQYDSENTLIIGSNNLTISAFNDNIEIALHSKNKELFDNTLDYLYFLWRDSININDELLSSYSMLEYNSKQFHKKVSMDIEKIINENKPKIIPGDIIKKVEDQIKKFREINGLHNEIIFWRDVTPDEIITILKHSNRLSNINQRELIIELINEDCLKYKSTKAIGSWLNYLKVMTGIGFWDDLGVTLWGKIALEKYEKSKFGYLLYIQFCILVIGNLFTLCTAINNANTKYQKLFSFEERILKNEWIDKIEPIVNDYLRENQLKTIGNESLRRYFPTLFNKYGLEKYITLIKSTIYEIDLSKLANFILEYGTEFNLSTIDFQDDFIGNI